MLPGRVIRMEIRTETPPVRFDTKFDSKIAVLLRDDLHTWQRLNVTAFLVSGLGSGLPDLVGEPYRDADGTAYLPMFRQPVLVFEGGKELLVAARAKALASSPAPCSRPTCSAPATTGTTAPPSPPCRAPTSTSSASPSTARATPSTGRSRERGCTREHRSAGRAGGQDLVGGHDR